MIYQFRSEIGVFEFSLVSFVIIGLSYFNIGNSLEIVLRNDHRTIEQSGTEAI
jgi:hypothetical protein